MKNKQAPSDSLPGQYRRLCSTLANLGYISDGSVLDRSTLRHPRSGYQWTRKLARKTVTVALSSEQFLALRQAIANRRHLQKTPPQQNLWVAKHTTNAQVPCAQSHPPERVLPSTDSHIPRAGRRAAATASEPQLASP